MVFPLDTQSSRGVGTVGAGGARAPPLSEVGGPKYVLAPPLFEEKFLNFLNLTKILFQNEINVSPSDNFYTGKQENQFFYCEIELIFRPLLPGASPPNPHQGLRPWTPLGAAPPHPCFRGLRPRHPSPTRGSAPGPPHFQIASYTPEQRAGL